MAVLQPLVSSLAAHARLSVEGAAALLALPATTRELDPLAYLLREGQQPTRCGIIVDGYAIRHKMSVNGDRQIVGVYVPGDPFDLQSLFIETADHNIQTLTQARIIFVERDDLRKVSDAYPCVTRAILTNGLIEASIFREWILNIGRRDAVSRLAHLLCELIERLDVVGHAPNRTFELPMTQEQLGDALGLTAVHVNRTLKLLETEGLISRTKRVLVAQDWTQLRQRAGFTARYLHLDQMTE